MLFYHNLSHYKAENILQTPTSPAHSGPELCYAMPRSILADKLASEVVLERLSVESFQRPAWTSGGGSYKGLKLHLD